MSEHRREPGRREQHVEGAQVLLGERLGGHEERRLARRPRRAWQMASAATTVLPAPTSPCSSRRIGRSRRRSRAISRVTRSLLGRQRERQGGEQRRPQRPGRHEAPARGGRSPRCGGPRRGRAEARPAPRAPAGAGRAGPRARVRGKWTATSASATCGRSRRRRIQAGSASMAARAKRLRSVDQLADPPGGQRLGGRVDRHQALRVTSLGAGASHELVCFDHELRWPSRFEAPAEEQLVARLQHAQQVVLVEPDGDRGAGRVRYGGLDDPKASAAGRSHRHSSMRTRTVASSSIASSPSGRASS